jgi:hypothetical protein
MSIVLGITNHRLESILWLYYRVNVDVGSIISEWLAMADANVAFLSHTFPRDDRWFADTPIHNPWVRWPDLNPTHQDQENDIAIECGKHLFSYLLLSVPLWIDDAASREVGNTIYRPPSSDQVLGILLHWWRQSLNLISAELATPRMISYNA